MCAELAAIEALLAGRPGGDRAIVGRAVVERGGIDQCDAIVVDRERDVFQDKLRCVAVGAADGEIFGNRTAVRVGDDGRIVARRQPGDGRGGRTVRPQIIVAGGAARRSGAPGGRDQRRHCTP